MNAGSLSRFFAEIVPYVMGTQSADDLEARLGTSVSGRSHLEVYGGVVQKNVAAALAASYPAVKHAADNLRPGLWRSLVRELFAAYPPRHFDPNRVGEPFTEFLQARRARDPQFPAFFEELADYNWIRFRATTSREAGRERTVFIRLYTHAVPAYARAVEDPEPDAAPPPALPEPAPVTVIVYRSPTTLRAQILYPSQPQLVALARHDRELPPELRAAVEISDEALDAAEGELRRLGVIAEEHR